MLARELIGGPVVTCTRHTDVAVAARTPTPDFLSPDVDVEDAAEWLIAAGYQHLPGVENGHILGMVCIEDSMWALTNHGPRRPVRLQ